LGEKTGLNCSLNWPWGFSGDSLGILWGGFGCGAPERKKGEFIEVIGLKKIKKIKKIIPGKADTTW
jgi:hypothetical protein